MAGKSLKEDKPKKVGRPKKVKYSSNTKEIKVKENLGGRPTLLTEEMQEKAKLVVENVMAQGGSLLEVAFELGINRDTIYDWQKKDSQFSGTIAKGKMLREIWFEKTTRDNLGNKDFNTTLFTLYAVNANNWTRKDHNTIDLNLNTTAIIKARNRVERTKDE